MSSRRQSRPDSALVDDILDSAARIRRVVDRGWDRFQTDPEQQDVVERRLEVIGEAVKLFSQGFVDAHPELPIVEAGEQRDFIIHEYWKTDMHELWDTITEDVPEFAAQLTVIRREIQA